MFMHGGLLHLAGNMLFLWIFGNNIEDSMGRVRFVAFYLLGGLAAVLAQTCRPRRRRAHDRRQRGGGGGARRLRAALPARARGHADLHHHLLHGHRAARAGGARALVLAPGCYRRHRGGHAGGRRRAAAWPTSRTSAASSSGWLRSSCSPTGCTRLRARAPDAGLLMAPHRRPRGQPRVHRAAGVPHGHRGRRRRRRPRSWWSRFVILAMLGFGVIGALTNPPEE